MRRTEVIRRTLHAVSLAEPHLPQGIGFSAQWRTNGRARFSPRGHVNHTTEDARPVAWANLYRVLRDGHGAISGNALCNTAVRQTGRIVVMASGTAWHAGAGGWRGRSGNASVWGTEYQRGQGETLTPTMLHAGRVWDWALSRAFGWTAADVCEHSEWSPGRKSDRRSSNGVGMSGAAWRRSIVAPTARPAPAPPPRPKEPDMNATERAQLAQASADAKAARANTEKILRSIGGRGVGNDLRRLRISLRPLARALQVPVDHEGPDDGTTVIS